MPPDETEYLIYVGGTENWVRVFFLADGRNVLRFTVQLETVIDGVSHAVVRYDTAHGFAHRDLLDWDGSTYHWEPMAQSDDFAASLSEAVRALKANWRRYREDFVRRRP